MIKITCCKCGEVFGLVDGTYQALRRSSATFYCPFGHGQSYTPGPSREELLRKEVETLKQQGARLEDDVRAAQDEAEVARRAAAAQKGVATRMRNRARRGVCICCNRTFQNLAAHMATKHPHFSDEENA